MQTNSKGERVYTIDEWCNAGGFVSVFLQAPVLRHRTDLLTGEVTAYHSTYVTAIKANGEQSTYKCFHLPANLSGIKLDLSNATFTSTNFGDPNHELEWVCSIRPVISNYTFTPKTAVAATPAAQPQPAQPVVAAAPQPLTF